MHRTPFLKISTNITRQSHAIKAPTTSLKSPLKPPSRLPSLHSFLLRQRVLALYRKAFRLIKLSPNPTVKREMRDLARQEFAQHKAVQDDVQIRYLLSTGATEIEKWRGCVEGF